MRSRAALCLLVTLAGCNARPIELSVDVRTDLIAGADFRSARVELFPGQGREIDAVVREVSAGDRFWEGVRVADYAGVPLGVSRVRASLLDAAGEAVLSRNVDVTIAGDYALTIVLSADCVGRACPGASEPASFTECVSGECVDPRCGGSSSQGCGDVSCEAQRDCTLDCPAACIAGACVCVGSMDGGPLPLDDGGRDAGRDGGRDAGPCPGECAAGATEDETRACGACGEGTERRTRTCGADCRWGAFSEWGACATGATCAPGATDSETRGCGNCDLGSQSRTRSCDAATCTWGAWSAFGTCSGGGACAPGATRAGGCDSCSHQVCSGSCTWGGCTLRSGNTCNWESGMNWRCCGGNAWQFCLSSCRWSTDCAAGCGCGC